VSQTKVVMKQGRGEDRAVRYICDERVEVNEVREFLFFSITFCQNRPSINP